MSTFTEKLKAYAAVLPRAKRNRLDLLRFLFRRPAFLLAVASYEAAMIVSSSVNTRIKALASVKASSLIGCPY